ncbi:hypothetical protein CKO51_25645 [Rhodopirellula sp. SM50]|nr:hypothetical protein [Rhodopirellula sp. SM50]PAY16676.1 hypothetical protein CKO51_25645 [Rhodopirellula sp. SM50]
MNNRIDDIPIAQLELDRQNPRLPSHLKGQSEAAIISYMLREASTLELMLAIGQKGFFRGEPLLVVEEEECFRVVEGNRRLTALKLLKNPSIAPIQRKRIARIMDEVKYCGDEVDLIPCQVFDSDKPIHEYLGYRHITGIQAWDLTQKAAFLTQRWHDSYSELDIDAASRELAKSIGSRRDYVKRLLVGFQIFDAIRDEDFFGIPGLSESSFYFNYIADSLSRPNIAGFLGIDLSASNPFAGLKILSLKEWTHWFFEKNAENQPRIKATTEELRNLNAVLADEEAFIAFSKDGKRLADAFELTKEMDVLFVSCIANAIDSLETADSMTHKLQSYYSSVQSDLKAISRLVRKISSATEDELGNDES